MNDQALETMRETPRQGWAVNPFAKNSNPSTVNQERLDARGARLLDQALRLIGTARSIGLPERLE
jgi:hypothetical protein